MFCGQLFCGCTAVNPVSNHNSHLLHGAGVYVEQNRDWCKGLAEEQNRPEQRITEENRGEQSRAEQVAGGE